MPCSERFAAALEETETTPEGVRMYTWRAVRRQQLRKLRQPVRWIVLCMAFLAAVGKSSVFDGSTAPGSEDYGISYNIGYFLTWLLVCVLAVLWVALFSWWIPTSSNSKPSLNDSKSSETNSSDTDSNSMLYKVDSIILTSNIVIYLVMYVSHVVCTFMYVGPKPVSPSDKNPPLNTRKAWGVRALLFSGVCTSLVLGKSVFTILEGFDLAKVKPLEYMVIVVPIQINIGILMATAVQFKAEMRRTRKMAQRKQDAEVAVVDEKERLLGEN